MTNILIIAYNRIGYLEDLLQSLQKQQGYALSYKIWIAIDYSEVQPKVVDFIKSFKLKFDLEILTRTSKYGLKKNVIDSVTDLFTRIDEQELILLEDDLVLSPYTFHFIESINENALNRRNFFGVSLYAQLKNEWNSFFLNFSNYLPFYALTLPSSWGSIIYKDKWLLFRESLDSEYSYTPHFDNSKLPKQICAWSDANSWKKELAKFCIAADLYTLYPKVSCSGHFGKEGTNVHVNSNAFRNTNLLSAYVDFGKLNWEDLEYFDIYFETLPQIYSNVFDLNVVENLVVDLYGSKTVNQKSSYYLTSKKGRNTLYNFGFEFGNLSANILNNVPGTRFTLCLGKDLYNETSYTPFFEANYSHNHKRKLIAYMIDKVLAKLRLPFGTSR